jgi:hypothetical protein
MTKPIDLVQGTLDMLILKTLALESAHGWAIAQRIRQVSNDVLQVRQGALYPAPARTAGLDQGRVGRIGKQSPRKILFLDQRRAEIPRERARELGAIVGSDRPGDEPGFISAGHRRVALPRA